MYCILVGSNKSKISKADLAYFYRPVKRLFTICDR